MEKFNEQLQDLFLSTPVIVEAEEKVVATTELRNVARVIESLEFLRSVNNTTEPLRYIVRLKHNIVSFEDKTRVGFPIIFTFCPMLEGMPDDLFMAIASDWCTNNLSADDL